MRSRGNWHSSVWELSVIRDSHCMSYADHLPERRASVFCTVVEARQRRRLSRKGTFFLWRALVVWGNQDTRSTPLERAKEPIVLILMAEVDVCCPLNFQNWLMSQEVNSIPSTVSAIIYQLSFFCWLPPGWGQLTRIVLVIAHASNRWVIARLLDLCVRVGMCLGNSPHEPKKPDASWIWVSEL